MFRCPECSELLTKDDRCDNCEWTAKRSHRKAVDPNHGKCAWKYPDGLRCSRIGVISPSVVEPSSTTSGEGSQVDWFCAWHYECLTKGIKDDLRGEDYRDFYQRELKYTLDHSRRPPMEKEAAEQWDVKNRAQVLGVAMLTVGKSVWKKVPKDLQDAALEYLKDHPVPKIGRTWPKEKGPNDLYAEAHRQKKELEAFESYDLLGKVGAR